MADIPDPKNTKMMPANAPLIPVRSRIDESAPSLTPSERKLASVLLADYPFAGLLSIQELADQADVSPPSISRFTAKIGFSGYSEMQRHLLAELRAGNRSPVELQRAADRIEGGYLPGFLSRVAQQIQSASDAITEAQFQRICGLLKDPKRKVFGLGGRISDTLAQHLTFHLKQARPNVFHLPRDSEAWPEYMLRTDGGDLFFLVDFRRYETSLVRLAEAATERKVKVILMTDRWMSPAKRYAAEVIAVPIETGTVWDSYAAGLAIIEALVTQIAEETWDLTRVRIEAWDAMRQAQETRP